MGSDLPRKKPWSGLVGSVREEFRSRSGIALVDQDLRPSRKHERKGAAGIVGSDRCLDPCRSEQTLNDLRLVPRPIGADRDQSAHFRRDNRSLRGRGDPRLLPPPRRPRPWAARLEVMTPCLRGGGSAGAAFRPGTGCYDAKRTSPKTAQPSRKPSARSASLERPSQNACNYGPAHGFSRRREEGQPLSPIRRSRPARRARAQAPLTCRGE